MDFKILNILFFVFLFCSEVSAQSITSIKKEKEKSEKQISYLNKLLEEAKNNKSVSTEKLNILQQKILQSKRLISSLNQEVKYIQSDISANEVRIGELQNDRNAMLELYAKLVYGSWKKRNKNNKLMFIFSSSDFNQAYNRFKYFQQIQEYSGRQLEMIRQVNDSLDMKNLDLKKLIEQKNTVLGTINDKNKELESEQVKESHFIAELQKKEKELKKKLQVEMQNRQKLNKELNRLIARQAKKSSTSSSVYKLTPEEKLLSDDFAKNRGKLPWPVTEGFISEKFGVRPHPVLKKVVVENSGVNITTSKNAEVRSVFKGVVTEIFFIPGANNVVIIQHGNYFTTYPNLIDVKVQKGSQVNTKDIIGKVGFDSEKGSVLNFQIWKYPEKANQDAIKLDPEFWLAK